MAIGNDSYSISGTLWMLIMRLHFLSTPVLILEVRVVFAADRLHRDQPALEQSDLCIVVGMCQRREAAFGARDLGGQAFACLLLRQQVLVGPIVDVEGLHHAARGKV